MINAIYITFTLVSFVFLYILHTHGGIFEDESTEGKLKVTIRLMNFSTWYTLLLYVGPAFPTLILVMLLIPLIILTMTLILYLLFIY